MEALFNKYEKAKEDGNTEDAGKIKNTILSRVNFLEGSLREVSKKYRELKRATELDTNETLPCSGKGINAEQCSAVIFFNKVQDAVK